VSDLNPRGLELETSRSGHAPQAVRLSHGARVFPSSLGE